jgi:deglycase
VKNNPQEWKMLRYIFTMIIILSSILTACSTGAKLTASPVVEGVTFSPPEETWIAPTFSPTVEPTDTRLPDTTTSTVEPTMTEISLPSPSQGPTSTPWYPETPKQPCSPTDSRFCQILFVLPGKYYAEQARFTFEKFENAGFKVVKTSRAPEVVEVCSTGVGVPVPEKAVSVDLPLSEVKVEEYDAVVYIGGFGCQDQWNDEEVHQIARDALAQGKVIGAIGCAPTILAYAGIMKGKRSAICDKDAYVKFGKDYCQILESQGAICSSNSIERDGLIVTARQKTPSFVAGVIEVIMENTTQE